MAGSWYDNYFMCYSYSKGKMMRKLIKAIKKLMQTPTAVQLAATELAEAECDLLSALSAQDYAAAMVEYNVQRVKRLRGYLHSNNIRIKLGDE